MEKFAEIYVHIATLQDRVAELEAEVTTLEKASITRFMNNPMIPDKDKERVVDLYFSSWCPSTRCSECIFGSDKINCMKREHVEAILYGKEIPNDEHKEEETQTDSKEQQDTQICD